MDTKVIAVAFTVVVAGCGGGQPVADTAPQPSSESAAADDPSVPENPVRVSLVSDVTRVAPGQEISVGVVFDIEPGWHVYWEHPGDSGLPTRVELDAPASFELGPVRFPGPTRFTRRGGFTTFGWERRVVASAVARPVAELDGAVAFSARAEWLACRESCVRGRASDRLTLEVAAPDAPSAQDHAALWREHRAGLPRPLAELDGAAVAWESSEEQQTMIVSVPGARELEWFPRASTAPATIGTVVVPEGDGASLRVALRRGEVSGDVTGVVAVGEGDARRYYDVAATAPESVGDGA